MIMVVDAVKNSQKRDDRLPHFFFRKLLFSLLDIGSLDAVGCAMAVQLMVSGFNPWIRQEYRDRIYDLLHRPTLDYVNKLIDEPVKAHVQTCGLLPQFERGPANRTVALKAMPAAERTRPARKSPLFFYFYHTLLASNLALNTTRATAGAKA